MTFFYDNFVNLYDSHRLYVDVRMNFGQDCSLAAPQIYFFTGTPPPHAIARNDLPANLVRRAYSFATYARTLARTHARTHARNIYIYSLYIYIAYIYI